MSKIEGKLMEARVRWFGHVLRRKNKSFGKSIMKMNLKNKGKKERPKRRFMGAVKINLKVVGLTKKGAMDRERWRRMIYCGHA